MRTRRTAFTLIELLVVMAIIGLLMAMLMPAMSAVLASVRQTQCGNNLRQLGVAVLAYHADHGCYPLNSLTPGRSVDGSPTNCTSGLLSWKARLLPYLDQQSLYDQINFDVTTGSRCDVTMNDLWNANYVKIDYDHPNATVAKAVISVFLCPSDGHSMETNMGGALPANDNYAGNFGWPPNATGTSNDRGTGSELPYNGVFTIAASRPDLRPSWHPSGGVSQRDILDGTARTAMISEHIIARSSFPAAGEPPTDTREHIVHTVDHWSLQPRTLPEVIKGCARHFRTPEYLQGTMTGQAWISGSVFAGSGYMHVMPPNGPSCMNYQGHLYGDWFLTASSNHSGGFNILFADGHLDWIDENIAPTVWWALGSRDGREVGINLD